MHRSETTEQMVCADCGVEIASAGQRSYTLSETAALCWECALRRGGSYDEQDDRWVNAPSVEGLPREEG